MTPPLSVDPLCHFLSDYSVQVLKDYMKSTIAAAFTRANAQDPESSHLESLQVVHVQLDLLTAQT